MANGLHAMLLLLALAGMVAETVAQEGFEDLKYDNVDYPGPKSNNTNSTYCNKIMKERGLDYKKRNLFINVPDDDLIKICRTPQGQPLTLAQWSSFEKLPLTMCQAKMPSSGPPYKNYTTEKMNMPILVKCEDGFPTDLIGTGTGGFGR